MAILTGGNDSMREQTISTMGDAAVNRKGAREVHRRASPHQIDELSRRFKHESYTIYYRATVLSRASGFVYQEFVLLYGHQLKGQRKGMAPVDIGPVLLAIPECSSETTGYQRPLQTIAAAANTTGQSRACACVLVVGNRLAVTSDTWRELPACDVRIGNESAGGVAFD
jgi:hypothetical protein